VILIQITDKPPGIDSSKDQPAKLYRLVLFKKISLRN